MRKIIILLLCLLFIYSLSYAQPEGGTPAILIQDESYDIGRVRTINLTGAGISSSRNGSKAEIVITGGAPTDAEYIVSEANATLTAEVAPSAANQVPNSTSSTAASWTASPQIDNLVITGGGYIKPSTDSSTAINITKADGTTTVMVFDTSALNVGIAKNPSYRLHVANPSNTSQVMVDGGWDDNITSATGNSRLNLNDVNFGIGAGHYGAGASDDATVIWGYEGSGRGILFASTTSGSTTKFSAMSKRMFIDCGNGNVGIGVTDPGAQLQINTSAATTKGLFIKGYASQSANLQEWQDSSASILSQIDSNGYGFIRDATFALAVGTPATVGTNKTNVVIMPRAGKIVKAFAYAKTAPTGAALIFDINLNGTSIWNTTQANRIQIAAGANSGTQTSFDTTAIAEVDYFTIDIDQIGSGTAGQDITVLLHCQLRNA